MATLKEFEDLLRQHGMSNALALLDGLRKRDRENRSVAPARRIAGRKMTADLARAILDLHATTGMTQQEIAFKLGVNQGRVNEVIKRGKWLSADPRAPEAMSRDRAMERLNQRSRDRRARPAGVTVPAQPPQAASSRTPPVPNPSSRPGLLPLERTRPEQGARTPRPQQVPPPMRPLASRTATPPVPIVSAQLAFLDL